LFDEESETSVSFAVLIPAYNPDVRLIGIAEELKEAHLPVVAVDDGSVPDSRAVFEALAGRGLAEVLHLPDNRGKGAAIKAGIVYLQRSFPDHAGAVVMDADGQHLVADAVLVGAALEQGEGALILGARVFDGGVPWRSSFGNSMTRRIFNAVTGLKLTDTQTGLRGLPRHLFPNLLELAGTRYEYELEMLLFCRAARVRIVEVPIRTVYFDENRSSHFRPVADSLRIYARLARHLPSILLGATRPGQACSPKS